MKAPKMVAVVFNECGRECLSGSGNTAFNSQTHPTNRSASYSVLGVCTVHGVLAQLANKYVVLMVTVRNSDRMS